VAKQTIYWICQVIGWSIYGILTVIAYTVTRQYDPQQAFGVFLEVIFYLISTHILRTIFIKAGWLNLKLPRLIPRLLVFTYLFSGVNYIYLLGIESLTNVISSKDLSLLSILVNTLIYWLFYFLWSVFYIAFHYVDRYNKSLRAKTEARETELNNLKAQLNPHFIFNALNGIRALVDENPEKSKESITQLSHILRNSLVADRKNLVPFSEELKTVTDYLALESIRYEERLTTKFDIDRNSGGFMVPPLMLQTLVENGIKHGITNLKGGGEISISTKVKKKYLTLKIRNSGQLSNNSDSSTGYGLENTKKRLKLIFGEEAGFKIRNESPRNVLCSLSIPTCDGRDFT